MWGEKLIELTKDEAYEGIIFNISFFIFWMIKSRDSDGIEIVAVELKDFMPVPTDKVIAQYKNIDEMIAYGCFIVFCKD